MDISSSEDFKTKFKTFIAKKTNSYNCIVSIDVYRYCIDVTQQNLQVIDADYKRDQPQNARQLRTVQARGFLLKIPPPQIITLAFLTMVEIHVTGARICFPPPTGLCCRRYSE